MNKQFNRQRRHNNSNARTTRTIALQQITRFTNLDSSGPLGKLRGTPLQLTDKYQAGAKDAHTQGDTVLAQTCLQYADHYLRLQNIAIENEQAKAKLTEQTSIQSTEEETENAQETSASPSTTEETGNVKTEEPQKQAVVVEKRPLNRRKKVAEDILSMPMDALQEKSEPSL